MNDEAGISRRAIREAWFERGADAFQRARPGAPRCYVCPLCVHGFSRSALDNEMLTMEHAPPDSLGGEAVALTCHDCNTGAGGALDSQMVELERVYDFAAGTMTRGVVTQVSVEDKSLKANVQAHGTDIAVRVSRGSSDNATQRAVSSALKRGEEVTISLPPFQYRLALLGWLRAAYLVAFACFGYTYVLRRDLEIVRRQLTDTQTVVLKVFSTTVPALPDERRILVVERPSWQRSLVVQMGRHVVFLPWLTTTPGLYKRLAQRAASDGRVVADLGRPWPAEPEFSFDFL